MSGSGRLPEQLKDAIRACFRKFDCAPVDYRNVETTSPSTQNLQREEKLERIRAVLNRWLPLSVLPVTPPSHR